MDGWKSKSERKFRTDSVIMSVTPQSEKDILISRSFEARSDFIAGQPSLHNSSERASRPRRLASWDRGLLGVYNYKGGNQILQYSNQSPGAAQRNKSQMCLP